MARPRCFILPLRLRPRIVSIRPLMVQHSSMATGPASSTGGASTSTKPKRQNDITEYLHMLENDCNVRPLRADSIMYRMQEAEGVQDKLAD